MLDNLKKGDDSMIGEMHGITSGMKALFTWWTFNGLETARQTCGGAGYLLAAGIAGRVLDYSPMVTYEGDNTVMLQ